MKTYISALLAVLACCAPVPAFAEPAHPRALGRLAGAPAAVTAALAAHAADDDEIALALTWGKHESGFANLPHQWSTDSRAGLSRCFLQVRATRDLTLDECAATWFRMLHAAEVYCGSRVGGLRALSSGSCNRAAQLVDDRMREARVLLEFVVEAAQ